MKSWVRYCFPHAYFVHFFAEERIYATIKTVRVSVTEVGVVGWA